ncbi:hypothetical protein GC088_03335 [Arthrobacter sp. JZ12]|nr:hypothetical protein GC088_03335 [Arthrobacter sp. JZ12]
MGKRLILGAAVLALALSGCGGQADNAPETSEAPESVETTAVDEAPEVPDLTGEWKQSNSNSEDSYQQATITADTITVEWVTDGGDTRSLYWVGSFEAPLEADKPHIWTSEGDIEAMQSALLASSEESKEFTYENGEISYEVSALGTTTTVRLEQE